VADLTYKTAQQKLTGSTYSCCRAHKLKRNKLQTNTHTHNLG